MNLSGRRGVESAKFAGFEGGGVVNTAARARQILHILAG
jgi:hypothetical protein